MLDALFGRKASDLPVSGTQFPYVSLAVGPPGAGVPVVPVVAARTSGQIRRTESAAVVFDESKFDRF